MTQQFVCSACGFNMIGFNSKRCRFCGATPEHFLTVQECSAIYQVGSITVSSHV
ncbi:MAG: hypothetical protein ACFB2X_03775 [Rivularia sp. (in: cyanobacteria)]